MTQEATAGTTIIGRRATVTLFGLLSIALIPTLIDHQLCRSLPRQGSNPAAPIYDNNGLLAMSSELG